jgi:hypothetical protein
MSYNINAYGICGGVSSSLLAQLISSLLCPVPSTGEESRYELPGHGGPGPVYVVYVFVFRGSIIICPMYKLPLSVQAQDTVSIRVSRSDLIERFLAGPPLGAPKLLFTAIRIRFRRP